MATQNTAMTGRGRKKKLTEDQVLKVLRTGDRPVWSAAQMADHFDVTRQTAHPRLKAVAEEYDDVKTMQVGKATVYYSDLDSTAPLEERHKQSLIEEFEDKFVGLLSEPSTAVHPNDGPAEAGDEIQIRVEGEPEEWRQVAVHKWKNSREDLNRGETVTEETQALISGELYAKPTTPIEHWPYGPDYDLELNVGGTYREVEGQNRPLLISGGVKNYLIKPCDDAVFLKDVRVDWISPKGKGPDAVSGDGIPDDLLEEVAMWREEHVEAGSQAESGGSENDQGGGLPVDKLGGGETDDEE